MKNKIIYALAISTAFVSCKQTKMNSSKTQALQSIDLKALDTTIQPADDFFLFANGIWIANTEIPASESRWGSFNELEKQNNDKLTDILKNAADNQGPTGSQNQILGAYYTSFTNMELRNSLGTSPLQEDLAKIQSLTSKEALEELVANLHRDGISVLFSFGIGQDLKNVDNNVAYIGQASLGLPNRDYYYEANKQEIRTAYISFISKALQICQIENAEQMASELMDFELALANKMYKPAEQRQPEKTYNPQSFSAFKRSMQPHFDMEQYLALLGARIPDTLIVGNPSYFENINSLIQNSSLAQIIAYFTWSLINHYASHLNEELDVLNFSFYGGVLSGKQAQSSIEKRCIDELTDLPIGELLGKTFVDAHFSKAAQNRVNEMVDNLLFVYRERLQQLDWMSDATKKEAIGKLDAIGRKLGFPYKWEDFSSLRMRADRYFWNYREIMRYSVVKNLAEYGQPVDKAKWSMPAHMVNAYYHPLLNEIAFPAGIMQAPFFDENYEDAVNYGRIGMVIGHEFTHGFDDMGSKFAADGSFTNWWTEEDRMLFEEKTKLLGTTFSGFCPMENHCVNPELTMGENIADLGGLTMAYHAYASTAEFKSGEIVNGYTPAQRFFIAYAQLWKIKYTDAEMKKRLATDPHSPGMYRVNGPLKNCPEFFEAFEIPEGREMRNDVKKVARIW
ncbi:MAG: M13 family metallopeptidase [Sphingomonadales bacterium]|nr:M13 family metallopeptidase [Sphingomonadales bacterium]